MFNSISGAPYSLRIDVEELVQVCVLEAFECHFSDQSFKRLGIIDLQELLLEVFEQSGDHYMDHDVALYHEGIEHMARYEFGYFLIFCRIRVFRGGGALNLGQVLILVDE